MVDTKRILIRSCNDGETCLMETWVTGGVLTLTEKPGWRVIVHNPCYYGKKYIIARVLGLYKSYDPP